MPNIKDIELDKIRIDGGTQPRAKIDMEVVNDYSTSFELGANFPPIDVFFDGKEYWLADGFHRYHAARDAHVPELPATVHNGTVRDAILFSLGCNDRHGLRRTNEDKRHSVMTMLNDPEWSQWSDRTIAEKCGVSHPFVSSIREKVVTVTTFSKPAEVKYTTSTGKTATMPVQQTKPNAESKAEPEPKKWEQGATSLPDVQEHAPEDDESDTLFTLKSYWRKASKKDRKAFLEWAKQ